MDPQNTLAQAKNLLRAGRADEAVTLLEQAARDNPTYADLQHQLGVTLGMAGECLRAEGHLRRSLSLNPRYAEAHLNLAILLSERGAYEETRRHLQAFNDLTPPQGNQPPDAALDDLVRHHRQLAARYRAYGMLAESEEQTRCALHLRPDYCDLRLLLAEILFERSRLQESSRIVESVLLQKPHYDAAHLLQARIDQERGHWQAAREALTRVKHGAAAVQARSLERSFPAMPRPGMGPPGPAPQTTRENT